MTANAAAAPRVQPQPVIKYSMRWQSGAVVDVDGAAVAELSVVYSRVPRTGDHRALPLNGAEQLSSYMRGTVKCARICVATPTTMQRNINTIYTTHARSLWGVWETRNRNSTRSTHGDVDEDGGSKTSRMVVYINGCGGRCCCVFMVCGSGLLLWWWWFLFGLFFVSFNTLIISLVLVVHSLRGAIQILVYMDA